MCGKTKILLGLVLATGGVLCALLLPTAAHAATGVNEQLSFQGKVVKSDGTNIPDGTYNMEFKIYQDGTNNGSGNTLKWTEDDLISASHGVTITSGTFQINLGAVNPFGSQVDWNQDTLWLSMQVGNTTSCTVSTGFQANCGGDSEMKPYIRMTATPYAVNALQVGGLTASQLVQLSPGSAQTGNVSLTTANSVTAGILQGNTIDAASSGVLTIGSTNATSISIAKNTNVTSGNVLSILGPNALSLGSTSAAGGIAFQDGTSNGRAVTVSSPTLSNSYSFSLPTSGAAATQCLASTSGSTTTATALQWTSCTDPSTANNTLSNLSAGAVQLNTDLTYASGATRNLNISQAASGTGNSLIISAGQGATTSNQAGGNLTIQAGAGGGSGTQGSVIVASNGTNSSGAFKVQDTSAASMLSVDTSTKEVDIGSGTTDSNQVLLQLDSYSTYAETTACTTTNNQGGMYYNTSTNAIRACVNGGWEDLVSTAGLGILGFGVISDTGANPGDTQSLATSSTATGPCQPYRASATSVGWTACSVYSSGRKIVVSAGTLTTTNSTSGNFQHLCLNGSGNQPALSTSAAETSGWPTFSAASPVLCLADIKYGAASNTISEIYDTRVFTNSQKEFAYTAAAMASGNIAVVSTAKITSSGTTAGAANIRGVIGVSDGSTVGTNGGPNAILVTGGPVMTRVTAATAGQYLENGTTSGYGVTTTTAPTTNIYSSMGLAQTSFSSTCSTQINCFGSVLVNLAIR